MAGRARGLVLLVRDPLCRGIMQIYKDPINFIALYLASIRRIPRRGMRPDFGSGGVARPLSALLRLAMLARRLAARHRPPKLGSGAKSITRLQDMMRCVIGQRCCAAGAMCLALEMSQCRRKCACTLAFRHVCTRSRAKRGASDSPSPQALPRGAPAGRAAQKTGHPQNIDLGTACLRRIHQRCSSSHQTGLGTGGATPSRCPVCSARRAGGDGG